MKYELRVLMVDESTLTHPLNDIREVDELVPLFGQKMSEVKTVQVVATGDGVPVVIHKQSFA